MSLPPLELFIASVLAGLSLETAAEDESQLSYIAALVGEEVRLGALSCGSSAAQTTDKTPALPILQALEDEDKLEAVKGIIEGEGKEVRTAHDWLFFS